MKKLYINLLCVAGISLAYVSVCSAQTGTLALNAPKGVITIDGNSQEWGDSLAYYNPEKKVHYMITNDKTNLYLVVKTNDPVQQGNIMNAGLTFSVDTKGRKRSAFSTTFPSNPSGANPAFANARPNGDETLQQKSLRATMTKFKKIKVDGFKDISEDDLGTTNPYGIMAAVNYDADGSLVYEEAIPLELFHATPELAKGEWSFNIKMNSVELPPSGTFGTTTVPAGSTVTVPSGGGGGGKNAMPGRRGTDPTAGMGSKPGSPQGTPTIDFWGKFTLAK